MTLLGFDRVPVEPLAHPHARGAWTARFEDVGRLHSAFTRTPGDTLFLPGLVGPAWLALWCTPWSGVVRISDGHASVEIDTYAATHTLRTVAVPGTGQRDVTVELLAHRNPLAADHELWLHRLIVERAQPWSERVIRLTPSLEVANVDHGTFLTISGDVGISHAIRTFGVWGREQVELFARLLRPGNVVVDVGANIGHHSVVMSRLVGPAGRVFAFEPQPFVYRVLEANLALNRCDNTEAHRCALAATEGYAAMSPMDYERDQWNVGGLGIVMGGTADAEPQARSDALRVQVRRLDDVLPEERHVDFIKCDAQGFDLEVLRGARRVLAAHQPTVLVEVAPLTMPGGPDDHLALYRLLLDHGYVLVDPNSPPGTARPPHEWSGAPEEWDVLAIPESRLSSFRSGPV